MPRRDHLRSAIDHSLTPLLRERLLYLAAERGLAENSLWAYRRDLIGAEAFLTGRGKCWRSAVALDFTEYLQSCSRAGLATRTVRRRFAAVRGMLLYLADRADKTRRAEIDTALARMEAPKPEKALPKILSIEQVKKLIEAGAKSPRDRVIFALLYDCGLRVSEVCGLRLADVNLKQRTLRTIGKGSKEREVPMTPCAASAISHYIDGAQRERVLISPTGQPLTRERIYQIVRKAGERAGLTKRISPHVLRHCFATHLKAGGADLLVIKLLLGHESVDTTEIYTHVDRSKLKQMHTQCHPRRPKSDQLLLWPA